MTPHTLPSSTIKSVANAWGCNWMDGSVRALAIKARKISLPVESPCACRDPRAAVGAFARKGQLCAVAVELHAPVDELLDLLRTFFDQHADGFFAAESIAGDQRVMQVKRHLVVFAERRGDASLGIFGAGFIEIVFGENKDVAALGQIDSSPHSGNSPAQNDEIHSAVLASHHVWIHHSHAHPGPQP